MTYTLSFVDPKSQKPTIIIGAIPGKWIACNGLKRGLCDGYCRNEFEPGQWYFKQDQIGCLCETCADQMIGRLRPGSDSCPEPDDCLKNPCDWPADDCPFSGCPRR